MAVFTSDEGTSFPCLGFYIWCRVGAHDELMRYVYIPHPLKTILRLLDKLARGLNAIMRPLVIRV